MERRRKRKRSATEREKRKTKMEKKQKKLQDSKKGRMVSARKLFGKGCCVIKSLMGLWMPYKSIIST